MIYSKQDNYIIYTSILIIKVISVFMNLKIQFSMVSARYTNHIVGCHNYLRHRTSQG